MLQGEEIKKVEDFKDLASTVQRNGECGKEVETHIQAGWNGWKKSVSQCDIELTCISWSCSCGSKSPSKLTSLKLNSSFPVSS